MSYARTTTGSRYNAPPLLVVTDLDGSLLDHYTYSFNPARTALDRLRELKIPLIPNTSKTSAELGPLRRDLKVEDPYIVENGSAIFLPRASFPQPPGGKICSQESYLVELGLDYREILRRLTPLRQKFNYRGYSDFGDNELEQLTGLDHEQLALSRQRQFSEPLMWLDSDDARDAFLVEIRRLGLHTLQGGRFLHVLGRTDKGVALNRLRSIYEQVFGQRFTVMALGDSGNDIAMLEASDWPVVISSPSHDLPHLNKDRPVTVSSKYGPEGWNECVLDLIERYLDRNRE